MELVADDLACWRGGRLVFSGVSFRLKARGLMKLTGPNGAGKSSLIRLVAGLGEAAAGTLALEGGHADLAIGQQAHLIAHHEAVKTALTVAENLVFWRDVMGGGDLDGALAAFDLARLADYPAAMLSEGQRRRLALSRLALVPRALWLLDEPTVGLDAASLGRLKTLLAAHLEKGGLAIAATHVTLPVAAALELDLGELKAAA